MTKHGEPSDDKGMEIRPDSRPIDIFEDWMTFAKGQSTIREPTAMSVGTYDPSKGVHVRVVLCKFWTEAGFTFFTNYNSQKGQDLEKTPSAGAVFYWDPLFRQIKISGSVEKTSREVSKNYWQSRARGSQLSQYISHQSQPVASREILQQATERSEKDFDGKEIPCPEHWGGYLLRPKAIEFWIGQPNRLHDRHVFENRQGNWTYCRLYP